MNIDKEMKILAGLSNSRMLEADPINDILKKARKNVEKEFIKSIKGNDTGRALSYLCSYRMFTKLLNREPLSIFDF